MDEEGKRLFIQMLLTSRLDYTEDEKTMYRATMDKLISKIFDNDLDVIMAEFFNNTVIYNNPKELDNPEIVILQKSKTVKDDKGEDKAVNLEWPSVVYSVADVQLQFDFFQADYQHTAEQEALLTTERSYNNHFGNGIVSHLMFE